MNFVSKFFLLRQAPQPGITQKFNTNMYVYMYYEMIYVRMCVCAYAGMCVGM